MSKHRREVHPEEKLCSGCKELKTLDKFNNRAASKDGKMPVCKKCHLINVQKWRKNNPEKKREQGRRDSARLKAEVIQAYGGFCKCCGETEPSFLTIDHIAGNGAELRKENPREKDNIYRMLRQQGFPKENYQLLCMNCNWSKGAGANGECIHSRKARMELRVI